MSDMVHDWLDRQPRRYALFTDIDNTLVRQGTHYAQATKQIRDYTAAHHIPLILVTGLSINQVLGRIETGEIPQPEVICSAVGTEIWLRPHDNIWQKDIAYSAGLTAIGFDAAAVNKRATAFIAMMSQYDFVFQPRHDQGRFKVSLHCMATHSQIAQIQQKAMAFFAPFKVVVCQDITAASQPDAERQKFCLDIVPVTKGDAVAYLLEQFDIRGGWKAGDSGNDVEMLLRKDCLTPILVGGHTHETSLAMLDSAKHKKGSVYKLEDGRKAYIETGSQKASQSILEALQVL